MTPRSRAAAALAAALSLLSPVALLAQEKPGSGGGDVKPADAKGKSSSKGGGGGTGGAKLAETAYAAGERAFNEDDFVKAVDELNNSMMARPSARAAQLLGRAHFKLEQFDEARGAWNIAMRLEKKSQNRAELQRLMKNIEGLSSAKLRIDSLPEGATVYVDMKAAGARGKTPVELSTKPGRHRVILALEGFDESVAVPDPVAINGKTTDVMILLRPKGCDVSLSSKVHEVVASVDGGTQFALPSTARVAIGKHRITFNGKGYASKTSEIDCQDFKPIALEESLDKLPDGIIAIRAQPGWLIYVDDQTIQTDKARQVVVRPGEHHVEVQEAGKTPWHANVTVVAGQEIEVLPQPQVGQKGTTGIKVTPYPADAFVYLDGNPLPGGQLTVIRPGKHAVEAQARGHVPFRTQIDVKDGDIRDVEARPQRRSRWALWTAVGATVGAAVAEGVAIFAMTRRDLEPRPPFPSPDWTLWNNVSIGCHAGAAGLAAIAIAGYAYQIAYQDRAGLEPPQKPAAPRVGGAITPNGGSLVLSGEF